jgi:CubicO group peptidase (beta-lactamase class C family)
VVYAKAIGDRLITADKKIDATPDTRSRIGSISKMFTGVMIFQLIEEKKLTLDTKLARYFPSVPNAGKITIAQMLGHRSGIHNFTDDDNYLQWNTQSKTEKQMLEIVSGHPSEFEPGSKAEYSNSNYLLLGYIIEKITGQSYAANLGKRIVSKLGLKNTAVGGKTKPEKNESFSYQFAGNWEQESETDMSVPGGAGSLVSTASDLTRFAQALFSKKLISAASLSQMKDIKDGYGMAMFRFPFYEKSGYGHTGGIDGFSSILCYFPADSVGVAYISNGGTYPINDILIGVLSIYYKKPYTIPDFSSKTVELTEKELEPLVGTYASSDIPLKVTITRNGTQLMAQATGQNSFPLEATAKDKFKFDPAGVEMEFFPDKKEFVLRQGGGSFRFSKEN